jgi:hypothetical protein
MGREIATIDKLTNWNHLHLEKTFQDKTTKLSEVTRKINEVLVPTAQNLTTLNVIIASDNSDYAAIHFHHSCSSTTNYRNYPLYHISLAPLMKQLSEWYMKMLFVLKTTIAICIPNKKNIKSGFTKNAQYIRNKVLLKHISSTHCIKKIPLLHKEIYIQRNDKVRWTNCISPNSEKKSA